MSRVNRHTFSPWGSCSTWYATNNVRPNFLTQVFPNFPQLGHPLCIDGWYCVIYRDETCIARFAVRDTNGALYSAFNVPCWFSNQSLRRFVYVGSLSDLKPRIFQTMIAPRYHFGRKLVLPVSHYGHVGSPSLVRLSRNGGLKIRSALPGVRNVFTHWDCAFGFSLTCA